jgi:transposase
MCHENQKVAETEAVISAEGNMCSDLSPDLSLIWNESPSTRNGHDEGEEKIIAVLVEQERGMGAAEVCRKHGISAATCCKWKARESGLRRVIFPVGLDKAAVW